MTFRKSYLPNLLEIQLLTHDRVQIPGLGVFVAQHKAAEYDEATNLFYPPTRTLTFIEDNSDTTSSLIQEYVDCLDICYPDAQRMMLEETETIKSIIANEGEYVFHGLGVLSLSTGRSHKYTFKEFPSGIATPDFFALNSYELKPLATTINKMADIATPESKPAKRIPLRITMPSMRRIAAAAAVAATFIIASLPAGNGSSNTHIIQASILSEDMISSIIEKPAESAFTTPVISAHEIAEFNSSAMPAETVAEVASTTTTATTTAKAASPVTVNVNISLDDIKKQARQQVEKQIQRTAKPEEQATPAPVEQEAVIEE